MPRPSSVTEEEVALWEIRYQEFEKNGPFTACPPELRRDVFYSGEWLYEQLCALGATREEIEKVCFATGQRQAFNPDPWVFAVQAVEWYKKGIIDEPGLDLAEKLFQEKFGHLTRRAKS